MQFFLPSIVLQLKPGCVFRALAKMEALSSMHNAFVLNILKIAYMNDAVKLNTIKIHKLNRSITSIRIYRTQMCYKSYRINEYRIYTFF